MTADEEGEDVWEDVDEPGVAELSKPDGRGSSSLQSSPSPPTPPPPPFGQNE